MRALLSTAYLAPVSYYALLYGAEQVVEERCEHYVKQTYRNRCVIDSPHGPLALTLPVVRKGNNQPLCDVELSSHNNWQHVHWTALVSSYENSPYFEYYADDFRPIFERPRRFLVDFNEDLRQLVCSLLELDTPVGLTVSYEAQPRGISDFRNAFHPKHPAPLRVPPYYQVFSTRHAFLPDLSIVDLLFNLGPEARLVLKAAYEDFKTLRMAKPHEMNNEDMNKKNS